MYILLEAMCLHLSDSVSCEFMSENDLKETSLISMKKEKNSLILWDFGQLKKNS